MARAFEEQEIINIGYAFEEVMKGRIRPGFRMKVGDASN
jgi:hypothetical protein